MALTDLQYIRLMLTVPYRVVLREELAVADGTLTQIQTQLWPLISGKFALYEDGTAVDPANYTLDEETGLVTFATPPTIGALFTADYTWAVFSDEQINGLLERYNDSVEAVLIDLVRALLSNSDLFVKYTIGMETIDRSKAYDSLKRLLDDLTSKPVAAVAQAVIWTKSDITEYGRDVPWADTLTSTPQD